MPPVINAEFRNRFWQALYLGDEGGNLPVAVLRLTESVLGRLQRRVGLLVPVGQFIVPPLVVALILRRPSILIDHLLEHLRDYIQLPGQAINLSLLGGSVSERRLYFPQVRYDFLPDGQQPVQRDDERALDLILGEVRRLTAFAIEFTVALPDDSPVSGISSC